VEISAQSEETGSNETIVAATIEGIGLLIAFNVKYMREVLEVIKARMWRWKPPHRMHRGSSVPLATIISCM